MNQKIGRISFISAATLLLIGLFLKAYPQFDPAPVYAIFRAIPEVGINAKFDGFQIWMILPALFCYLITFLLGITLISPVCSDWEGSFFSRAIASFGVGYFAVVALTRIISLILPHGIASWGIAICILAISFRILTASSRNRPKLNWKKIAPGRELGFVILLFVVIFGINIFQADFSWIGHGTHQYPFFLSDLARWPHIHRFPILTTHHDELLYHYFVNFFVPSTFDPALFMNSTLTLNKISAMFMTYLTLRNIWKLEVYPALCSTALAFFGTASLDIFKYSLIFDSNNPLALAVHSGRVLGFPICFFISSALFDIHRSKKDFSGVFYLLVGIGLICSPLHNYFFFIISVLLSLLLNRGNLTLMPDLLSAKRMAVLGVILFLLISLTYELARHHQVILLGPGVTMLPVLIITIYFLVGIQLEGLKNWTSKPILWPQFLKSRGWIILAHAFTLFYLANHLAFRRDAEALWKFLGQFYPFATIRMGRPFPFLPDYGSSFQLFVDVRELGGDWNLYNRGFPEFTFSYGSAFLIMVTGLAVWFKRRSSNFWFFSFSYFLIFSTSFLFMDFSTGLTRPWLKSRLLEIPFYFSLLALGFALQTITDKKFKRVIPMALIFLFCFVPFFGTSRPQQIVYNYKALIQAIRSADSSKDGAYGEECGRKDTNFCLPVPDLPEADAP